MKKISHILFQIIILTIGLSATVCSASPLPASVGSPYLRHGRITNSLPSVSTNPVTNITSATAECGGNVLSDGGSPVTARGVCWSTEQNPTIADDHTVDGSGTGTFSSSISGLHYGQTYYVRAYATNSEGTSYGQELQFTAICVPIVTWDTIHVSPNEMPYAYGDTLFQPGTPDSSEFIFQYVNTNGCDSIAHVTLVYRAIHAVACFQYRWAATGQTYTTSGMYLHHYYDSNGQLAADTLFLTIHSPAVALNPIAPVNVCVGNTIAFSASASGTGPITYNWTGPSNFSSTSNNVSIPNATSAHAGAYTVTASTTDGPCTDTATKYVVVTVNSAPNVGISGGNSLCAGGSLTLTATGARTYRWSNGSSATGITVSPSVSTSYGVTGTDVNGCTASAMVSVTVNALPNMGISGNSAICEGKSVTLNASGASSYTWSTGATGASITQTLTSSTTYSVTGTNANGCSASATATVTVNPNPNVGISGGGSLCEGRSVTLSASGASSYSWSTGATGTSITETPTANTTYSVTGTSTNGCTASASKTVTVNPMPSVSISGGGSICAGQSATLTASGANTYHWSHGKTGSSITETPTASTNFIVEGTDANGCTASAAAQVIVNPLPSVFILGIAEICENESVILTASGARNYTWSTGSSNSSITVSPTTSTTYSVTGTDINLCRNYASVEVTVHELPIVTISGDDKICDGENTELTASGAETYVWSNGITEYSQIVEPTSNTTYSVTGTDENGCANNASFTVEVGEGDDDEVSVTACESYFWHVTGETYRSSGTYTFNYENDDDCLSHHTLHLTITHAETHETSTSKCDSYTWGMNGQTYTESGTYSYTHTSPAGCPITEILNLTIKKGTQTEESVSECENYIWPANGQTYSQSGNYLFEYTGSNGCPSTRTLHLTIKQGTQEEMSASAVNSYTWEANGMTYTQSGDYVHHYTNEDGCESSITLHLTVRHEPGNDCIRVTMEHQESCSPGEDGVAFVYIPAALRDKCEIEWQLAGGTSSEARITNLKKGTYHVKVKSIDCPDVVFFQGSVEITKEDDCDVKVHVSGPTNVTGNCNGIPSVTFTAQAYGGVPPYSFQGGWEMVSSSSAVKTITPGNGHFSVACTVIDADNNRGSDVLDGYAKKLECAKDPNEIKGPNGYSEEHHFVNASDKMNYTIEFENDPDFAMAPASRVKITYNVPEQQRIASFRLADFGFGSFIFTVPSNVSSYSQRLDVSDSLGVWVDVNAGIDVVNHQLFWIFQSIDPATGAEPASSQMGFLPINDSLEHGQGYVNFYILPSNSVQTGDTVAAEALIVFDDNAPIGTNVWTNTFDATPPTSTLHAELNASDSLYCTFTFDAQDAPGGSGVQSVEVFVSINENAYVSIGSCPPDSSLTYALNNGIFYQFMSIATDNVGNTEPFKTEADTSVNYNDAPIDIVLDGNSFYEYAPVNTYIGRFITLDNDLSQQFSYELVEGIGSTDNNLFLIENNELKTNALFECSRRTEYSIRVRSTDIGGLTIEKSFTLNEVILHETPITYLNDEICQGESYNFFGQTVTEAGNYSDTLTSANGCDSIVTLFLTVNPVSIIEITDEICPGGSYDFFGQTLTERGVYHHTLQSVHGCDSIFTLTLMVNQTYETPVAAEICEGDVYDFYGQTLTGNGTYTQILSSIHGCDSTITLTLTVNQPAYTQIAETICQGDTFNFFGQDLTAANVYHHTLQTIHGCDSVIELTLFVNPSYATQIADTICEGETYAFFGQNLTAAGIYNHSLPTANGCDSSFTLTLTVNPTFNTPVFAEICQGESYLFSNQTLTESGVYYDTLQSINGCDSVITLTLDVHPVQHTQLVAEINIGESYDFFGQTLTETGVYENTLTTIHGCDSVITLTLTVNPVYYVTINDSICQGESYDFFGQILTQSGDYHHTLQASDGNDSIITLNLTLLPTYDIHVYDTTSCGEVFLFGDTTILPTVVGAYTYVFHYSSVDGCDSIVTLHLNVTVGVNDYPFENAMIVYPNPTNNILNVKFGNFHAQRMELRLYDAYGKLLKVIPVSSDITQIDMTIYANGVYFVRGVADGRMLSVKKVIKN